MLRKRITSLFLYVKALHEEFTEELQSIPSPERRTQFVLNMLETDLENLPRYKQQLYMWDALQRKERMQHSGLSHSVL